MKTLEQILAVRAYVRPEKAQSFRSRKSPIDIGPSDYVLILNAGNTPDFSQRLTLGCFQVRKGSLLLFSGFFYDSRALTEKEVILVKAFAKQQELRPPYKQFVALTRSQFVKKVFLPYVDGL